MKNERNILLLGFMGTGKSAVGSILAERLNRQFIDMDALIEEREGRSISDIFKDAGEPYFRSLERGLIQELAKKNSLVVAGGGGVVLDPRNISDFSETGIAICLKAAGVTILKRVAAETHRPLLESGDKGRQILQLLESRRSLYDAVPYSVDTESLTPSEVADRIGALMDKVSGGK